MKILLRTPLSPYSGYGRDGFGLARALLDRDHDVRISPVEVVVPLPRDIAGLLTYPLNDGLFDLSIHHVKPADARLTLSDKTQARRNLLWSMWEWKSLPPEEWVEEFTDRVALFDWVVAYDTGSAGAFAPHVEEGKLLTVQGGYEAEDWSPPETPRPERPFTFGMNGRLTLRKGVYAAYTAFSQLKEQHGDAFDARLVLKTTIPVFPPEFTPREGVQVILGQWDNDQLLNFYHSLDCLLCPSWGEGKNLPALEALACATPVVLSEIPGHKQWATSDLVTWVKTSETSLMAGHVGGLVTPEDLAETMWYCYTHREEISAKTRIAARVIPQSMDWSHAVERLSLVTGTLL